MNRSTPGLPVHHHLPEFTQTYVHQVGDAISHLILCRPLLVLPPIPRSIRVFSNESTLHIRWPKYWSFSFSIIPSKEHPGLISFRMDWLDLLLGDGNWRKHSCWRNQDQEVKWGAQRCDIFEPLLFVRCVLGLYFEFFICFEVKLRCGAVKCFFLKNPNCWWAGGSLASMSELLLWCFS